MRDFQQLQVWQHAHQLVLAIYEATLDFPESECYSLMSQMHFCSASIAANIAEGCGRLQEGELQRFLSMARGSAAELEYYLILARDLGLIREKYQTLAAQTRRVEILLASFNRAIEEADTTRRRAEIKIVM